MDSMFSSHIRVHGSIPTDLHTLEISSKILRDEETLLQYMTSDTRALKTAQCSKKSMIVIKRCTIMLPAEHYERLLELSDEAESCFGRLNWYGQYCITGRTRQSTFFAVSTYSADTKQELDRFASTLSVDFNGKAVSVEAASSFEMGSSNMSGSIRETHEVVVVGCSSRNLQHRLHTIDIQKAWVDFLEHYTPIPVLAHITHYANIDIRIKHPEGSLSITEDFRNAAELAQLLQVAARSNRLVGARALEISVQSTILKLADIHIYAEDDDKALQQCVATLKNLAKMMTETEGQTEKRKL
ncbi:hypothetical protein B0T12DRAFT_499419 [Alternaria alternata]|nr:hypothetical protein B0T12DRAFT_499419 [Alternaria alternata]